jgi:hypothetical protein
MLTALLLSLSFSAPGDVEALLVAPEVETDTDQKAKLGDALVGVFPNAVKATVRNFNCRRENNNMADAFGCDGWYKDRQTEAVHASLRIDGKAQKPLDEGAPAGMVDFWRLVDFKLAPDEAALTKLDDFIQATFVGLELADVYDFRCSRDEIIFTKITCNCTFFNVISTAVHHTMDMSGSVMKALRIVP